MTDIPELNPADTLLPPGETSFRWVFDDWQVSPNFLGTENTIVGLDWRLVAECADPPLTAHVGGHLVPAAPTPGAPFMALDQIIANAPTPAEPLGEGYETLCAICELQLKGPHQRRELVRILNMKANAALVAAVAPPSMIEG